VGVIEIPLRAFWKMEGATLKKFVSFVIFILLSLGCSNPVITSEDPDEIIKEYTGAITNHAYDTLVDLYGGDYEWMSGFSPESERSDKKKIFENYLKVIPEKIYLNEIISKEVISNQEVIYTVTFRRADGSLFDVGDTQNRNSKFRYTVKKIGSHFKVMDPPPYQA
jgi:hypothetical protein